LVSPTALPLTLTLSPDRLSFLINSSFRTVHVVNLAIIADRQTTDGRLSNMSEDRLADGQDAGETDEFELAPGVLADLVGLRNCPNELRNGHC
jgi:hypothetical protein